jgi:hypothetical protein
MAVAWGVWCVIFAAALSEPLAFHPESDGFCATNNPCTETETCCNTVTGPGCCSSPSACCCPDGKTCCAPQNGRTMVCNCTGTCPGTGCICNGCTRYNGTLQASCNGVGPAAPLQPYQCSPNCRFNQTCCLDQFYNPHCCDAGLNPVCCGVNAPICCPYGYACDTINNNCIPPQNSQPDCAACVGFIESIANSECSEIVCDSYPPPESTICSAIVDDLGLCSDITSWLGAGYVASDLCLWFQFCSGPTCSCGYCNSMSFGRCLSLPNICPASGKDNTHKQASSLPRPLICFDGTCDTDAFGCCLTCF